ncbi:MAG: hypothetical protein K2Y27_26370 [Xanthobacteraceae bacterium]|nr:hypothetical protein [Xanthobacteraceae bacterium]
MSSNVSADVGKIHQRKRQTCHPEDMHLREQCEKPEGSYYFILQLA